jgi:hypothetical protein
VSGPFAFLARVARFALVALAVLLVANGYRGGRLAGFIVTRLTRWPIVWLERALYPRPTIRTADSPHYVEFGTGKFRGAIANLDASPGRDHWPTIRSWFGSPENRSPGAPR